MIPVTAHPGPATVMSGRVAVGPFQVVVTLVQSQGEIHAYVDVLDPDRGPAADGCAEARERDGRPYCRSAHCQRCEAMKEINGD